ncbi:hypothetical protein SARC_10060 [Sphaeroforma arctica JP610]|uniref:DDE Tnp4 domain-containing protein n=1 Tax=Sphaeroforma arctica JP610 TaxID=667725 RepID=A0A0L0FL19_9EUKA|nr:hypothetical protein SARC_10060 [Sphaeroforma arctica JP610]KNC77482.1 hypothetical protein SARC_10060 [Sphaeroforma arctica JP610]|eukprot:XP_014151384.1 hypothetical protein SARC_10060 [Sphaeroforma arctica JP610]
MDEELHIFYTRRAALRQRLANAINEDTSSTMEESSINTSSIDKEADSESSSDEDSESEDNITTTMIITTILTVLANIIPVLKQSNIVPRGSLVYCFRPSFDEIAGHMLQMNSFHIDMRMSLPQFLVLIQAITPMCERDEVMESLRNGSIDVGVQLAITLRDNAYTGDEFMLVPCPGRNLGENWDAFNFFQSQTRMHIERAFGIFVRKWGILWKPIQFSFAFVPELLMYLAKLHSYCIGFDDVEGQGYLGISKTEFNNACIGVRDIFEGRKSNTFRSEYRVSNKEWSGTVTEEYYERVRGFQT